MGSGNKEKVERGMAAAAYHAREAKREEYAEYRAEQRACGYEVESFEEWLGEVDPREAAEARVVRPYYYPDMD
jgi:hypothetical protein